jgi:hypothetical protein
MDSRYSTVTEGASPFVSRSTAAAFTGFGSTKKSGIKSKKKKQPKSNKPHPPLDLSSAQNRMEHIASCIQRADISPMGTLKNGIIDPEAVCHVDNFLGSQMIEAMRAEAESLIPTMVPSQSTRWDEETQSVIVYEKEGVLSTQIEGGPEGYAASPLLVEYVVTLTQHLTKKLNGIVPPEYRLSGKQQTNKLAVCLGNGSKYDKHIDNMGGGDKRKMTALLYLQPPDSHADDADEGENDERGGYFRAYDVPQEGSVKVFAPRSDRLLLFWSDSLVHDVSPSFVQDEKKDKRWALTVWFVVEEGGTIQATNAKIEKRHFGTG